jgi:hypothetical protein
VEWFADSRFSSVLAQVGREVRVERQDRVHRIRGQVSRAGDHTQPVLLVAVFRHVLAWEEHRGSCRLQAPPRNQQDARDRPADVRDSAISRDLKKVR